ncbi:hypothetical protein ACHAWX_002388 [Stephanocyclus meneghinianus]
MTGHQQDHKNNSNINNKNHRRRILRAILFPTIALAINYTRLIHEVSTQHSPISPRHGVPTKSAAASSASASTPAAPTTTNTNANGRTPRRKSTWHERFAASDSDHGTTGFLFFKHIRKAGGTTLRAYFRHVLRYHGHDRTLARITDVSNRTKIPPHSKDFRVYYMEQEFDAMDHQCPALDPRWRDSLRIVSLRHPVERIVSEFFYSGPGRFHPVDRTRLSLNDTEYLDELGRVLDTMLPEWTTINYARRRETRENRTRKDEIQKPFGRYYTDNFQLRALAGCSTPQCLGEIAYNPAERRRNRGQYARLQSHRQTHTPINEACTLHFIDEERMFDLCNKVNRSPECPYGCDAPCFYPTAAWYPEVNATHLRWAKETLREFDVILLMETMDRIDQSAWLSDVLGVPRDASFALGRGGKTRNYGVEKNGVREKTHFYRDLLERLAKDVSDLLHEENALEIQLFEYAVELNRIWTEQWKREVGWMDE